MKRRDVILGGGVLLGAAALGWSQRNALTGLVLKNRTNEGVVLTDALGVGQPSCVLTADQVEGPFFLKAPMRSNIREDRKGLALDLAFQIVNAKSCKPIEGAGVEVWHCDAAGRYSGYPEDLARKPFDTLALLMRHGGPDAHVPHVNDKTYLRGAQLSGANGMVRFQTILPGWYEPRVTHIHVKVITGTETQLSTQLYFSDEFLVDVYGNHPDYKPYDLSPYKAENDLAFIAEPNGQGLMLHPRQTADGIAATCKLGIA
ncbi:MAG: hypothetical protein ABF335_02970 [Alphaproteobacteria bacterium]